MYKVYMHLFPNGKRYIGITSQELHSRFDNGNGYKGNPMKRAIKKYGWENIKHFLLFDNLTKDDAEKKEIELIKKYNSNNIKYGYNIASGGHSSNGCKHSDITKKKMSDWHKGKIVKQETKDKLSKINREDLTNKKFGRLTALYPIHNEKNKLMWVCKCDCGNIKTVKPNHLKSGAIKSCGCLSRELCIERNKSEDFRKKVSLGLKGNTNRKKVLKEMLKNE